MKRNCSLDEISDGKLYGLNDMVKLGCNGCEGCSACCRGMGASILLDPYDIFQLSLNLNTSFQALLEERQVIELNVVEGLILPNIKLTGALEQCPFLNEQGRCSIHAFRPGFCRLFPLGRYYEDGGFHYILQIHECTKENKTKIKIRKWIGYPNMSSYDRYVNEWHYFLLDMGNSITEEKKKAFNLYLLNTFFINIYDTNVDFFTQFTVRLEEARRILLA